MVHITLGLVLILFSKTKLEQLEENAVELAQAFGVCQAEQNEKWAKYLLKKVLKRIMILDGLIDGTTKIAKQTFKMSSGIKLEWGHWSTRPKKMAEKIIEGNMIFAVCQYNIRTIPKLIPLLGQMRMVVALPSKKNTTAVLLMWEMDSQKRELF